MNPAPVVLIMAGGVGSRFWPLSRENKPKQFLDIIGSGESLLMQTFNRFAAFVPTERIFIITHADYCRQIEDILPGISSNQIISEPSRNNTAPSVAYASLKLSKLFPDSICIVAPADHLILKEDTFQDVILKAVSHATSDRKSIITLGIHATRPDTGYGYIEYENSSEESVKKVISFREKPGMETAIQYLNSGKFVWNAGIFIWSWEAILGAFHQYASDILIELQNCTTAFNTPDEQYCVNNHYPKTTKISIDYAILEKSDAVYTIPCDLGWSDLGTWASLYTLLQKDDQKNVSINGPVYLVESNGNLIRSQPDKLIAVKGLSDYIIVDTADCLLIYPINEEQSIKQLREEIEKRGLTLFL